jgi:hypothetical protein
MEFIAVIVAGCVLAIPIMAIVALVRTGKLRDGLDERFAEQQKRIWALETEVSSLRREMEQRPNGAQAPSVAESREVVQERRPAGAVEKTVSAERSATSFEPVWVEPMKPVGPPVIAHAVSAPVAAFQAPSVAEALEALTRMEASGAETPASALQAESLKAAEPVSVVEPRESAPVAARSSSAPAQHVAAGTPLFAPVAAAAEPRSNVPPRKTIAERLRTVLPLEELLGMNLFAKIGIVLLVLGFALLGRVALVAMGPGERVALIYAVAGAMLGGGIWLERKERYRLVGRTGIGGGWALLFFTTYALHHVTPMMVLGSNTLDCALMLAVAIAMVVHTLRYNSQLVTGLAFLLAFSTVALSQDTVYSLAAGVILALGIVAIALRMGWFELEVFGIAASYANHFYWLYKLYPDGMAGHSFPQFWASAILLIGYWIIFRISYIVRRVRGPRDETISTVAALLNSVLLLAVMKFQSTRPEPAFYALLGLGAVEFGFGQLKITRRRRPAFILLTVLGTILIFAAVPFKFSGNNIALLWMIAAEVLLVGGIAQLEVVFRRLGLLGGGITGLLILYGARGIVELRQTSQAALTKDGILLLVCSVLFYVNAQWLRPKWDKLFVGIDRALMTGQSYLGAVTAFLGVWAVLTGDWTAIGWAALMLAMAWGKRRLDDNHLLVQCAAFAAAVVIAVYVQNAHLSEMYPHHVVGRIVTLPMLAAAFYGMAWLLRGDEEDGRVPLRTLALWSGSALLAGLAWIDIKQSWVAVAWVAFAVVLSLMGRRFRIANLSYQEHLLAVLATAQLAALNFDAGMALERYIPPIGCGVAFYAISRFCTVREASYRRPAAWAHTWAATGLLAALAWHESALPWVAVIWGMFALGLALTDRIWDVEELPYQAHLLALLGVVVAVSVNLYSVDKWHGMDVRLVTVAMLAATLYALARWVRMPQSLESTEARHGYTWAASGLFAWMLWSELQPISVAVGVAVFGLALFEVGQWRDIKQLRLQGYVAMIAAFVRIFFVNLTAATLPGEAISPRIYTVAPIALIYFFVWGQLQSKKELAETTRWKAADFIAYLGTGSVVALLYFQVAAVWIVLAWAIAVMALMTASLLLDKEIFLHQAELLVAGIVTRALAHNIFGGSYFVGGGWRGNIGVLSLTAGLLLLTLPIGFRLRARYAGRGAASGLVHNLGLRHPEQILFFAPVILISCMIAVKMDPGMVTLSWGVEGVMVILLGLLAGQRSYRITGLALLLLCVAKIVVRDAWHLDERDRYITFIALGGALTLVSTLYGKYRETVRRLL